MSSAFLPTDSISDLTEQQALSSGARAAHVKLQTSGRTPGMCAPISRACPPQDGGFSDDEKLTFLEQSRIIALHQPSVSPQPGWQIGPFQKGQIVSYRVAGTGIRLLPKTCFIFCWRWLEGKISLSVFWAHCFCTSQEAFKIHVAPVLPLAGKRHIRNEITMFSIIEIKLVVLFTV